LRGVEGCELPLNFLDINFQWINVQISLGYNYQYPNSLSAYMKENYCRPAVYRWIVWKPTVGFNAIYVGETEDLARRITHCLVPGKRQLTNLRLKAYFDNALTTNELIELQTLQFEQFQINKVTFSMSLLGHAHVRRMLENLVLVVSHSGTPQGPPMILNRILTQDMERMAKNTDAMISQLRKLGLTEDQGKKVIDALRIAKT
jgi:hypothetical protein